MAFRRSSMSSSFRWTSLFSDCSDDSFRIFSCSFGSLRSRIVIRQLYFSLNSVPLRLPVSGEAHSHMRTLRLVALVVFMPCGYSEHMGAWTPSGIQALPFFGQVGLSHSLDSGLMPALYLLSRFLLVPSFPTSDSWLLTFFLQSFNPGIAFFSHSSCLRSSTISMTDHLFLRVHGSNIRSKILARII